MKAYKSIVVPFIVASIIGCTLGQGFWANQVFCTRGKGSTAMEPGYSGTCARAFGVAGGIPHSVQTYSENGDCDPCFDIPALQSQIFQGASSKGVPDAEMVLFLSNTHGTVPGVCTQCPPYPQGTDFLSPALQPLRTTILLI